MGAGVASILAFIIKNDPMVTVVSDKTFAFGYATPGTIICSEGLEYFKTFCTSVVLGDDVVPRLSPKNVSKMKQCVAFALENCHEKKAKVIAGTIVKKVLDVGQTYEIPNFPEWEPFDGIYTFMPGHVLHIVRSFTNESMENTSESNLIDGRSQWRAFWVDARDFDDIIMSSNMGLDHLPNKLSEVLRSWE